MDESGPYASVLHLLAYQVESRYPDKTEDACNSNGINFDNIIGMAVRWGRSRRLPPCLMYGSRSFGAYDDPSRAVQSRPRGSGDYKNLAILLLPCMASAAACCSGPVLQIESNIPSRHPSLFDAASYYARERQINPVAVSICRLVLQTTYLLLISMLRDDGHVAGVDVRYNNMGRSSIN